MNLAGLLGALEPPHAAIDAIPAELRARPQWILWRRETVRGGETKVPYRAGGAKLHASTTDPATWSTHEQAVAAWRAGHSDGIGFVFSAEDPYAGVDLDHCREAASGALLPEAQAIIDALATYTEISQSGSGVHLILRAALPAGSWHKVKRGAFDIELYDQGRYFCMSGLRLGTEEIGDRQTPIEALMRRYARPESRLEPSSVPGGAALALGDDDLIRRALAASNGAAVAALWRGDTSAYGNDDSAADMALLCHLAFYLQGDAARIDAAFRRSGLMREKWERRDYRERSIAKAIEFNGGSYYGGEQSRRQLSAAPNGAAVVAEQHGEAPAPDEPKHVPVYSMSELAALAPEQVDWVLSGYLAREDVASLESPPKGGKSTLARKMSMHVASGEAFLGCAVRKGPVLYCTEERRPTSREGFARAGALGLPGLSVMFLHDCHGMSWEEKVAEIGAHCARLGVVLVTIDTLSKWAGLVGEEEQSSGVAMAVMGPLQRLAATGPAVLVIRHERKSGGATGEAGRGSSAFTGEFDSILSLRKVAGEKTRRKLGAVGRHDETPDEVVIDYAGGEYVHLGDPHDLRRAEQDRAIIALLPRSRAEQVLLEDLCTEAEVSRSTARRLLLELTRDGVVGCEHGGVPGHPRADGYWLRGDDD